MAAKSTVAEIRERFDNDVERFSNLETGQQAAMDSVLCLDLITQSAAGSNPGAKALLDIGCGAGNWSIKLLGEIPGMSVTLLDLSRPMLDRAQQRVTAAGAATVKTLHVLRWDGRAERMSRIEVPFSLLRMRDGVFRLKAQPDATGLAFSTSLRVADIERFGPALLVDDTMPNGDRVLLWSD